MSWYALENIDTALQDSKDKLLPFDLVTWAKLAIIILLTGHAAGGPSYFNPGGFTNDYSQPTEMNDMSQFSSSISQNFNIQSFHQLNNNLNSLNSTYTVLFILGFLFLGIIVFLTYITSIFQFVMYKSMISEVKITYAKEFLSEGLQYLIFRWITLIAIIMTLILGIGAGSLLELSFNLTGILIGSLIGIIVLTGIIAIASLRWIAFNLALPEMIRSESNLSNALQTSIKSAKSQIPEIAVFWLMKLVISIGLGIAVFTVMFPVFLILLIPFGIIGFILGMISPVLVVPVVMLYLIAVLILALLVTVPARVYIYNYILEMHEDLV